MFRGDSNQLYAVWDGRFQPFHLGHLAVIRTILETFGLPLVVMIIQSSDGTAVNDYVAKVNIHHAPKRNPLTLWERYTMVSMALAAERLDDTVTVLGIPRPDVYWDIARSFYPSRRFICLTGKDEYERSKAAFWHSLGEEVRVVPTAGLSSVSATRVKELIKSSGTWQDLLHPSIIGYFEKIGAPERFRAVEL